ncbi:DUF3078 domain-containing protein [Bacteroidales bacterium OttesenSCG-928-I14]|nr:DUF3078 domain-containing protein [Bacteroidales bacterium OttesenSCG-928-I14]
MNHTSRIYNYLFLVFLLILSHTVSAFTTEDDITGMQLLHEEISKKDSLLIKKQSEAIHFWEDFYFVSTTNDVGPNPYLIPTVFNGELPFDKTIKIDNILSQAKEPFSFVLPETGRFLTKNAYIDSLRKASYNNYVRSCFQNIRYTKDSLSRVVIEESMDSENIFRRLFEVEESKNIPKDPIQRFTPKARFWQTAGSSLLQVSQNYISDNWYKGGNSNLNLLSVQKISLKYKKKKVSFNNDTEWKLSFNNNTKDTTNNFQISEDMVRSFSDFGIKAFHKQWSYSTSLEIKTQTLRNRKVEGDKEVLVSSAFAPLYVNLAIGLKYDFNKSYSKYKKVGFDANMSPLALQSKFVFNNEVDPKRYGIEDGKKHTVDFGSTINAKISVQFNKHISFNSRFKYFTNYSKIEIESENELNMQLSQYFSTRFFIYARFDDAPGIKIDDKLGRIQLNELLSFGFNYKW